MSLLDGILETRAGSCVRAGDLALAGDGAALAGDLALRFAVLLLIGGDGVLL